MALSDKLSTIRATTARKSAPVAKKAARRAAATSSNTFRDLMAAVISVAHTKGYELTRSDDAALVPQHQKNAAALAAGFAKIGLRAKLTDRKTAVVVKTEDGTERKVASVPGKGLVVVKGKRVLPMHLQRAVRFAMGRTPVGL